MPKGKFLQLLDRGHMVATRDLEDLIQEMKTTFPIRYEWLVIHDYEGVQIRNMKKMPNAKLSKNRANAVVDNKLVLDWFIKFFGDEE